MFRMRASRYVAVPTWFPNGGGFAGQAGCLRLVEHQGRMPIGPARGRFPGGGEYCVLPAFDQSQVFLEAVGEKLRYRSTDGSIVPDYPPREFA